MSLSTKCIFCLFFYFDAFASGLVGLVSLIFFFSACSKGSFGFGWLVLIYIACIGVRLAYTFSVTAHRCAGCLSDAWHQIPKWMRRDEMSKSCGCEEYGWMVSLCMFIRW